MGKIFSWHCVATGSRAGHALGQQHCNSFAQSTQARAWLRKAHANSIDEKGLIVYSLGNFRPATRGYYDIGIYLYIYIFYINNINLYLGKI